MKKTCNICGYTGENVWRDNKYYCAACGSEIDVKEYDPNALKEDTPEEIPSEAPSGANYINATCPICKNTERNTFSNGKCHCALCGTTFDVNETADNSYGNNGYSYSSSNTNFEELKRLEDEHSSNIGCGVICIFFFWPLAIYYFIKASNVKSQINRLKR